MLFSKREAFEKYRKGRERLQKIEAGSEAEKLLYQYAAETLWRWRILLREAGKSKKRLNEAAETAGVNSTYLSYLFR